MSERTNPIPSTPTEFHPRDRIVVGYDGSELSDVALTWAEQLARIGQRPLTVLVAAVDEDSAARTEAETDGPTLARQALVVERAEKATVDLPEAMVEVVSSPQQAVPALLEASRDAELLVVGAQGHGAVHGLMMGSVSQHVARHAVCPVVVVRPPQDPTSDRVVVGVDGSAHGRATLRFAFEHVRRVGGTLSVLYVISYGASYGGAALLGYADNHLPDYRAEMREWLDDYLDDLRVEYPDVDVSAELAVGSAGRLLADRSHAASLVVVGSRGRGGFAGLMLGSVSASVLHHATCPVAVVR
jgi:nucleotide-binding universal stress UspA family protein